MVSLLDIIIKHSKFNVSNVQKILILFQIEKVIILKKEISIY